MAGLEKLLDQVMTGKQPIGISQYNLKHGILGQGAQDANHEFLTKYGRMPDEISSVSDTRLLRKMRKGQYKKIAGVLGDPDVARGIVSDTPSGSALFNMLKNIGEL